MIDGVAAATLLVETLVRQGLAISKVDSRARLLPKTLSRPAQRSSAAITRRAPGWWKPHWRLS
ncbi:hypothetical protein [Arthrobacter sp. M4]|uniref:hypothetical protein n=1 Tax=Arthrobacter sp. M4 TaxID=218160 RepID=UPI001CDC33C4|nr:hypothetical protein [Arthrobacter sp. M4]